MGVEVKYNFDFNHFDTYIRSAIIKANSELEPILQEYAQTHHVYKNRSGNLTANTIAKSLRDKLSLYATPDYAQYVVANTDDDWLGKTIKQNEKLIISTYEKYIDNELKRM